MPPRTRGGDKFSKALAGMSAELNKAEFVKVGFLEDAKYPDGTSVAMIAAINEYGKPPTQPPRPFFRQMINKKSPGWAQGIATQLKANNYDAEKTLDRVGAAIKGQLQEEINTFSGAPLAASTIARKGHDKQLIDTSVMVNSVDYKVVKKQQ